MAEEILDSDLPIVDAHHHLWLVDGAALTRWRASDNPYAHVRRTMPRYLHDELLADLTGGHRIVATVYAECGSMYRASGPEETRCIGEIEFANGVAAMFASGTLGAVHACAGLIGHADIGLGDAVEPVLQAGIAAGGGRLKSIRHVGAWDPAIPVFAGGPLLFGDARFRAGLRALNRVGLHFDAWVLEPQLPDLIELADALPMLPMVLNHCGSPLGIGPYKGRLAERFSAWRGSIRALAARPNVSIKLGGLGMPICGFPSFRQSPPAPSEQLAAEWTPYFETCIESFGPDRCMFESNYPTDAGSADYRTLWNAFKRSVRGASSDEKDALFHDTAARFYSLELARSGQGVGEDRQRRSTALHDMNASQPQPN